MQDHHTRQPTEQVLIRAQQERERLHRTDENADAKRYVTRLATQEGWSTEELEDVIGALGLNLAPRTVLEIPTLEYT